jgi:hypothetical protein
MSGGAEGREKEDEAQRAEPEWRKLSEKQGKRQD